MSAPSCSRSSGSWPGACAPSTIDRTPAARAAAQISATGRTSAVGDVMCETETARVRGPMLDATSSGSQTTRVAPTNSHVRVIAPYSCAVVRISSSGASRSERMTALSADVAFGTNTRSSPRAPTKRPSVCRASCSRPGRSPPSQNQRATCRVKKSVGPRSSSSWSRWYSSKTSTVHAPKPPWLR